MAVAFNNTDPLLILYVITLLLPFPTLNHQRICPAGGKKKRPEEAFPVHSPDMIFLDLFSLSDNLLAVTELGYRRELFIYFFPPFKILPGENLTRAPESSDESGCREQQSAVALRCGHAATAGNVWTREHWKPPVNCSSCGKTGQTPKRGAAARLFTALLL